MSSHPSTLGAAFDPLHIEVEKPYAFYARLRQEEPITFNPALNAYLVSRYDDIRSIVSQPELFSSRDALDFPVEIHAQTIDELRKGYPFVPTTIVDDGVRHVRMRAPLQKALSPTRVRTMEPFIRETANRLIDGFLNDGRAEIISQFAYPLPLEIILNILGIPRQDLEMVKKRSDSMQMLFTLPLSQEQQVECARQFVALQHYYAQLIEEKREKPGEDLISDMIHHEPGEEPLSMSELISQITGVIVAGHETTTHLIGSGLILLLEDPERWHLLREHPEQIPTAIEEILRLHGPVQGFIRTATREVTVGDRAMPPGTRLFLLYASGNLDEGRFSLANRFNIDRQPNHHLAFGYGVHFCVGAALARLEGRIAFEILTQRIPGMSLLPDQQFTYSFNLTTYGYKRIHVQWT